MFVVELTAGFDFLSEEYAELFRCSQATAFQHPSWLAILYEKLVPQLKATPLIIIVRDAADGRLVMVLPLLRRRYRGLRVVEFADLGVSDYTSPVASAATIDAVAADRAACGRITEILKPFDMLRIKKLRMPVGSIASLFGATAYTPMAMSAYAVPLDSSFSTWRVEKIAASYRKELDKKSRQLNRKGPIAFERVESAGAIEATLLRMREFRRPRFESGDLLQDQIYFDFYLDVALRTRGALTRLYCLTMNGLPIAGVLGLSHRASFLVILSGFDHENYKNQSLGSLTFEMVAEQCIESGDCELDFTIGDEPYKERFGARKSPVYQIFRPGSITGVIAGAAAHGIPQIKSMARFMKFQ